MDGRDDDSVTGMADARAAGNCIALRFRMYPDLKICKVYTRTHRNQGRIFSTTYYGMKQPAVYILASEQNGTLYIGVTSNLVQRTWQHRDGIVEGFTQRYAVKTLVWYELHSTMKTAITREKALKKWNRSWKLKLIEEKNPQWLDLWPEIVA
ncbi:GIY-YIG nuclease family protein [Undibacterium sp. CCC2.1]|uniref:GIY-YIG nuclease family protein n=2 Tax=Undibacterium TaxID=401469 RepID=UPI002B2277FD|nr:MULTISPECIES: GIY-YIG nuclease family protein [unclassified Undibacterium]MEB0141224.1 GIY-YIG nuclease family protein [Undibacterium sp. CCC2.1]MEB0174229.1 GIY-YIG nuclease family protein [Undibacterium sp. CCC1.1]MEB0178166.1 GIY-YIG nuclease family protein [Undibacterium sp. CCC3.4]MEB0217374.1 GIY-YIG nuclease family protein [Undibacterium sp. 5I2]